MYSTYMSISVQQPKIWADWLYASIIQWVAQDVRMVDGGALVEQGQKFKAKINLSKTCIL